MHKGCHCFGLRSQTSSTLLSESILSVLCFVYVLIQSFFRKIACTSLKCHNAVILNPFFWREFDNNKRCWQVMCASQYRRQVSYFEKYSSVHFSLVNSTARAKRYRNPFDLQCITPAPGSTPLTHTGHEKTRQEEGERGGEHSVGRTAQTDTCRGIPC